MDAKLLVVGGEARVTEVKLKLPTTIGRGRSASLTLPHPLVSRQHCEIYEQDGQLVVNDLGSLNGTFVGDQRITEPTFLMPGELLTVGTVTFRADYELAEKVATEPVEFVDNGTETTDGEATVYSRAEHTVSDALSNASVESLNQVEEIAEIEDADEAAEAVEIDEVADEAEEVEVEVDELPEDVAELEETDDFEDVEQDVEDVAIEDTDDAVEVVPSEPDDIEDVEEVAVAEDDEPESLADTSEAIEPDSATAAKDDEDDDLQAFLRGLG